MASTINAKSSGVGGLDYTGDASGILGLQTGGTTAVTIDASQNVGIGTSSPANKLQVTDGAASTTGVVRIHNPTNANDNFGAALLFSNENGGVKYGLGQISAIRTNNAANYDGALVFSSSANSAITERMRIDSAGRVMVNGTDAASTWHYTGKFHVKSDAGSGSTVMSVRYAGTSAFRNISIENDNGQVGYIQTSNSTTTYSTSSDYRLKENILPMTNALDKVMQLNPVTFTWKSDGSDGQGFIAHELQAIIPDAVGGQKDGMLEDGTPDYQGVDTSFLVATLTAAIKEQQTIINDLKTRIEALEAK